MVEPGPEKNVQGTDQRPGEASVDFFVPTFLDSRNLSLSSCCRGTGSPLFPT